MTAKEMDKLIAHFDTYFQKTDCMVLHPLAGDPHIDILLCKPNNTYPYWKQVVLLTRSKINKLLEIGPEASSNYLSPETEDSNNVTDIRSFWLLYNLY